MIRRYPLALYGVLGLLLSGLTHAGPEPSARAPEIDAARASGVECDASVQHPIQIRIEALDPVRRGEVVRLRVTTRSLTPLVRVETQLTRDGGTTLSGPRRATAASISAERPADAVFPVRLPAQGERFLVEFRVTGEGAAGTLHRGAVFNLLPDGPTLPARIVAGADGRAVAEHAAGRIAR